MPTLPQFKYRPAAEDSFKLRAEERRREKGVADYGSSAPVEGPTVITAGYGVDPWAGTDVGSLPPVNIPSFGKPVFEVDEPTTETIDQKVAKKMADWDDKYNTMPADPNHPRNVMAGIMEGVSSKVIGAMEGIKKALSKEAIKEATDKMLGESGEKPGDIRSGFSGLKQLTSPVAVANEQSAIDAIHESGLTPNDPGIMRLESGGRVAYYWGGAKPKTADEEQDQKYARMESILRDEYRAAEQRWNTTIGEMDRIRRDQVGYIESFLSETDDPNAKLAAANAMTTINSQYMQGIRMIEAERANYQDAMFKMLESQYRPTNYRPFEEQQKLEQMKTERAREYQRAQADVQTLRSLYASMGKLHESATSNRFARLKELQDQYNNEDFNELPLEQRLKIEQELKSVWNDLKVNYESLRAQSEDIKSRVGEPPTGKTEPSGRSLKEAGVSDNLGGMVKDDDKTNKPAPREHVNAAGDKVTTIPSGIVTGKAEAQVTSSDVLKTAVRLNKDSEQFAEELDNVVVMVTPGEGSAREWDIAINTIIDNGGVLNRGRGERAPYNKEYADSLAEVFKDVIKGRKVKIDNETMSQPLENYTRIRWLAGIPFLEVSPDAPDEVRRYVRTEIMRSKREYLMLARKHNQIAGRRNYEKSLR